jgi:hypothetical protein
LIVTAAHPMDCKRINSYIGPATFISMMTTSIVSHGPGALETGPVCYNGAEEDTASKAYTHSEHPPLLPSPPLPTPISLLPNPLTFQPPLLPPTTLQTHLHKHHTPNPHTHARARAHTRARTHTRAHTHTHTRTHAPILPHDARLKPLC